MCMCLHTCTYMNAYMHVYPSFNFSTRWPVFMKLGQDLCHCRSSSMFQIPISVIPIWCLCKIFRWYYPIILCVDGSDKYADFFLAICV